MVETYSSALTDLVSFDCDGVLVDSDLISLRNTDAQFPSVDGPARCGGRLPHLELPQPRLRRQGCLPL